jgi:hypothetical protein
VITAYDRLLDQLEGVRRNAGNRAMARCPAHEDHQASLSIRQIEGGVLLYDHGGCDSRDVLAARKLTLADLWDDPMGAAYRYDDGRIVRRAHLTRDSSRATRTVSRRCTGWASYQRPSGTV